MGPSMGLNGVSVRVHNEYNIVKNEIFSVTITYRVREFEFFFLKISFKGLDALP